MKDEDQPAVFDVIRAALGGSESFEAFSLTQRVIVSLRKNGYMIIRDPRRDRS